MNSNKILLLLPVLTTGITVVNSSAFVFLTPGEVLSTYIACTTMFSLAAWLSHWVFPAALEFKIESIDTLRFLQMIAFVVCATLMNVLFLSPLSAAFTVMLAADIFFFLPGLLVIHSQTLRFQLIELSRGIANIFNLLACILIFDKSPVALVLGLTVGAVAFGFVGIKLGNESARAIIWPTSLQNSREVIQASLKSRNLRYLISARSFEISTISVLAHLRLNDQLIAIKLAVVVSQAISQSSRAFSLALILAAASSLLISVGILVSSLGAFYPNLLPEALQSLSMSNFTIALAFQLPFTIFLYQSLTKRQS